MIHSVPSAPAAPPAPTSAELVAWRRALVLPTDALDDAARLERIHRLDQLEAAVAAAKAVETAAFVTSRRAAHAAEVAATVVEGVGSRRRLAAAERGITADVGIATRRSPGQAAAAIRFALTAPGDLPGTFALMASGRLSERRAYAVHRATAWLTPAQRRRVDRELGPDLPVLGDRQVENRATAVAQRVDPAGAGDRAARAATERHVSTRPAPESMLRLSAMLPLVDGVACYTALDLAARTARANGDPRTRGQVMTDTLVERVTGRSVADAVAVELQLVMTDQALLGTGPGRDDPARVVGAGTLPARFARELFLRTRPDAPVPGRASAPPPGETPAGRSVRRLFTDPAGQLVALESTARRFTEAMARFLRLRDDVCRTPWCDAPIRHLDHVTPAASGGRTAVDDGRGLCEGCNYTAQSPGMLSRAGPDSTITTVTPTGQVTVDRPPPLVPGRRPLHHAPVDVEIDFSFFGQFRRAA